MPVRQLTCLCIAAALAAPVSGEDYFFAFGGGYAPSGNQVSLEKNFEYFRRVLRETGHADSPQHCLFADGESPDRDLQYAADEEPGRELAYLLAAVFQETDDIYNAYRSNALKDLDGPCTPEEVNRFFDAVAPTLGAGDRLFIYYTGHGGRGEKKDANNTTLELWNRNKMRMKEFVTRLDKVAPEVPVVIVMVQCYSGGFANVIFEGGDDAKDLAIANRAGFFATVHDRTAAGCTPDVNEANYQEYSSHFFAALSGRTRIGESVTPPDYDGDGRVSFDEAHAYTLLESDTIDISIKTSDALLRRYSRTKPNDEDKRNGVELVNEEVHYPALVALAGPSDKAVMDGLSAELKIHDYMRIRATRAKANALHAQRQQLGDELGRLRREYQGICRAIAGQLKNHWPELDNPWHPRVREILETEGDAVRSEIEGHEKFGRMGELADAMHDMNTRRLDLERQWVKCQRLIRTAENVVLAANLSKVAEPETCRRYAELIAAEHATLQGADDR